MEDTDFAQERATLSTSEEVWKNRQPFLERHGYMLRPRYRPDWIPSWQVDQKIHPLLAEDSIPLPWRTQQIDATRIADGRPVYIKIMGTESSELRICQMFSQEARKGDPRNHAVPILDVFRDETNPDVSYIVMPLLRYVNDPPFEFVADVLDFVDQVLEGLVFMHESGVAHRDCALQNLQMDASSIFPKGFHPVMHYLKPDGYHKAHSQSRLTAPQPVKYYFIDFGISVYIPTGEPHQVLGTAGIDQDVPELSDTAPYDPFKVDIFILGNLFNKELYLKISNVDFLLPLIRSMMVQDPNVRPDAAAVRQQWLQLRGQVTSLHSFARLRSYNEGRAKRVVFDVVAFFKLGMLLSQKFLRWIVRLAMFWRS